jgi:hypothetical protein
MKSIPHGNPACAEGKFPMIVATRQMARNRYDSETGAISREIIFLEISDVQRTS